MKQLILICFGVFVSMIFLSCEDSLEQKSDPEYIGEIEAWHAKRIDNLKKENGWLNLVGLFWLREGENTFGSSDENDVVFPKGKCPPDMGKFIFNDSSITVVINPTVNVTSENQIISEQILVHDLQGKPTVLEFGSLRWFVIKRGEKFGIRLRDVEADLVKNFEGIERFPVNSDWRIEATFEKYDPPKTIAVPSVLGTIDEEKSPGALIFTRDGKKFKLDVLEGNNSYFVVFADETSGSETYGGGRFVYVPKADSTGKIFIDFNKAYNPPCVFTKYATCPLPPKQNHLKMRVLAGEKNFGHAVH